MKHGIVEQAILSLAGRCDGANSLDGQGFNKLDTHFGHAMADRILRGELLTGKMKLALKKILPKYHRQFHNWEEIKDTLTEWSTVQLDFSSPVDNTLPKLDFRADEKKFYLYVNKKEEELAQAIPSPRWIGSERAWRYLRNEATVKAIAEHLNSFKTVTPEAQESIDKFLNFHREQTTKQRKLEESVGKANEIKNLGSFDNVTLPLKNWKRRDHQIRAFLIGTSLDHVALFMEQRTGKTPTSIAIAGQRFLNGQIKKLMIISPLTQMGGWNKDFKRMADFPFNLVMLDDSITERQEVLRNWKEDPKELQVVVTNYDAISRMKDDLIKWKPNMIICDESQRLKKGKSQRSKASHSLGTVAKHRLILTGTPITQSPLDIFSQYKFLNPDVFGNSFRRFRDRYVVMGGYGGYKIVGYRILPKTAEGRPNPYYDPKLENEFFEKVHGIAFRITRSEVSNLPPVEPENLYATLEPKTQAIYDRMEADSLLKLGGDTVTAPIILTQLLRLQQITGGFLVGESGNTHQISNAKLKVLESKLEDLLEDEKKTVVFARFSPEIKAISDMLTKKGIRHHVLEGGVPRRKRDEIIEDFQTNPETMVFVVQISTGGEGITLSAGRAEIFYSTNFSLTDYEQAKARIMEMDNNDKEIYNIVVENTVDEGVMDTLTNKRNIAKMVVDDLKDIFIKKGDKRMAKVTGSKKAQRVVDGKESAGGLSPQQDKELNRMLDELEKELKEGGKVQPQAQDTKPAKEKLTVIQGGNGKPSKPSTDKKPPAAEKQPTSGATVTLKELASDLKVEPAKLRKWLRGKFGQTEGRWEWEAGSKQLKEIMEAFQNKGK